MKGFVNISKPRGMTSSDVVVKVRGILSRAVGERQKVGHLGTLDPLAEGVLPIAVGNATRLFDYSLKKTKTYIATFKFGVTTDTLDEGGVQTEVDDSCNLSPEDVEGVLGKLVGEVEQMPPQYSAKSVGGRRAYDIAREGGIANLQPKKVEIFSVKLLSQAQYGDILREASNKILGPCRELCHNEFAFEIVCGSGTYIRSIARDMATELGTVGYMTSLLRVKSGLFALGNAITIDEFAQNPVGHVLPINYLLNDLSVLSLSDDDAYKALNGVKIGCNMPSDTCFAVAYKGEIVGIGSSVDKKLHIITRI